MIFVFVYEKEACFSVLGGLDKLPFSPVRVRGEISDNVEKCRKLIAFSSVC